MSNMQQEIQLSLSTFKKVIAEHFSLKTLTTNELVECNQKSFARKFAFIGEIVIFPSKVNPSTVGFYSAALTSHFSNLVAYAIVASTVLFLLIQKFYPAKVDESNLATAWKFGDLFDCLNSKKVRFLQESRCCTKRFPR